MRLREKLLVALALAMLALWADFQIRGTDSLIIIPILIVDGWIDPRPLPLW